MCCVWCSTGIYDKFSRHVSLSQLVEAVGLHAVRFADSMELFLKYLADKDGEVRNNAAFSVGVLAAKAATALEV